MTTETAAARPRRRIRAGIAAISCSMLLIAWVIALVYLAVAAASSDAAGVVAYVMFFASWIVVPVLLLALLATRALSPAPHTSP